MAGCLLAVRRGAGLPVHGLEHVLSQHHRLLGGAGSTDLEQNDGVWVVVDLHGSSKETGSCRQEGGHHHADLGGVVEHGSSRRQVRLLGAGLNSRIPFPARQREAALLQVGVEVVIDLGVVPGRVVDEAPTITFPGLGRMLQEGVEGEKLLLCIDDRPRKPSTALVLSPLTAVLVGPFLGDVLVLDP